MNSTRTYAVQDVKIGDKVYNLRTYAVGIVTGFTKFGGGYAANLTVSVGGWMTAEWDREICAKIN